MTTPPHLKFRYFDVRSKGEAVRYVLEQAGLKYEFEVADVDNWSELKPTLVLGQLPVLEVDGVQLGDSVAIGQYLALQNGLAGKSDFETAQIFSLVHHSQDLHELIYKKNIPAITTNIRGKQNLPEARKMWADLMLSSWKAYCDRYEQFLVKNGTGWLIGSSVSYADLYAAELHQRIMGAFDEDALKDHPKMKEHCDRVHALPRIKTYCDSHKREVW